jgi:phage portal protein BeeE
MEPIPGVDTFLAGWIYHAPGGELVPLDCDQVILEKMPDPLDPFRGSGPVGSIMANIEQQDYATRYQRNLFLNGADPGAIIQLPTKLTDREWNEFTSRWRESHQGVARAGRVGILENGAQWLAPAGMNNKDLEYGNLRLANRDEIREAWRMHKSMLGTVEDVNRANAATAEEVFTGWMTIPRLERRRDTLNCKLLPLFGASGQGVEFDFDDPTPSDPTQLGTELTAKATAAQMLVDAGYDQSDVLEAVGLPDMALAEKPTQMPVAPPGWVPAPPAAPAGPSEPEPSSSDGSDDSSAALTALLRASLNGHNGNGHHLNGAR